MRDIEVTGRVMNIYDIRVFNSKGREGKVGSIVIGDATGTMRLVMWNDQTENIAMLKAGDVVRVVNAYAKERMDGQAELHLNDRSRLAINPLGELVSEVKLTANVQRKEISQIKETDRSVEVLGTIVQVFDIRFFPICPGCGKKAQQRENEFVCEAHGKVHPGHSYVMNLFLDDGTDSIRVTFFRDQVLELTEKGHEEILRYKETPELFEDVKTELLGRIIKVNARVAKNAMFNSLELIANSVDINPGPEEAKKADERVGEGK